MYGELRCEKEIPLAYEIVEEDHHFEKEGEDYYRVSKIYRDVKDKSTGGVRDRRDLYIRGQSIEGDVRTIGDTRRSDKGVAFPVPWADGEGGAPARKDAWVLMSGGSAA